MKLFRLCFADRMPRCLTEKAVVTLGNFDGMHLGHQAILKRVLEKASRHRLLSRVVLFEPQPKECLYPQKAPGRLMNLCEKLQALKNQGIDDVVCIRFTKQLAEWSAQRVIEHVIIDILKARVLVVGSDFRFGYQRLGDVDFLATYKHQPMAEPYDLSVVSPLFYQGRRVSSTWVRERVAVGDFVMAEQLLGRAFSMSGRVKRGDGRGKAWGFATANVDPSRHRLPGTGVYLVTVLGLDEGPLPGVANLGNRPTVGGCRDWLEVHLLNFCNNIYGRRIQVVFLKKLREEVAFESIEALRGQVMQDIEQAEKFFAAVPLLSGLTH